MAKSKDTGIEKCLRRVTRNAIKKGEEITLRVIRSRVEAELGLEDGFLKSDEQWKMKSKEIIHAAYGEEEEQVPAAPAAAAATPSGSSKTKASEPREEGKKLKTEKGSNATATTPPLAPSTKATAKPFNKVAEGQQKVDVNESSESPSASDSDEEDSSESEADPANGDPSKTVEKEPAQVNGVKRKASSSAASDSSSEESESDPESSRQQKKAKTAASSASEEGSDEESSGSESEGDNKKEGPSVSQPPLPPINDQQAKKYFAAIPTAAYQPPAGFVELDSAALTTSTLSAASLAGKEIWHITIPSDIPLSSISSIAFDAVQTNTPILTHEGAEYTLNEQPLEETALLLPTSSGYHKTTQSIARSLKLQQKISLPNLTVRQASQLTGSSAAGHVSTAAVTTVPAQPKGLRMRYKPPGFGAGQPGRIGSGSESTDDEGNEDMAKGKPTFQFPKALGQHGKGAQQGENDVLRKERELESSQTKKKKKKKKDRKEDEMEVDDVVDSPAKLSRLPNGDVIAQPTKESKEERAKRKEEKKLKKLAKEKA